MWTALNMGHCRASAVSLYSSLFFFFPLAMPGNKKGKRLYSTCCSVSRDRWREEREQEVIG
jgi:hypothetical protein